MGYSETLNLPETLLPAQLMMGDIEAEIEPWHKFRVSQVEQRMLLSRRLWRFGMSVSLGFRVYSEILQEML